MKILSVRVFSLPAGMKNSIGGIHIPGFKLIHLLNWESHRMKAHVVGRCNRM